MANITKAALEQQVQDMAARIEQLEAELAAYNTPTHRVTNAGYVAPAWQAERAAQLAAARELAMRLGRVVRVASC